MKSYIDQGSTLVDPSTWQCIPKEPGNKDWQRVQAEVAAGTAQLIPPN